MSINNLPTQVTNEELHKVWEETVAEAGKMPQKKNKWGFIKTTPEEYAAIQSIDACDDCSASICSGETCYVDGDGVTLAYVVCSTCYLSNYGEDEDDDAEFNTTVDEDGRGEVVDTAGLVEKMQQQTDTPKDLRADQMKVPVFLPSKFTLLTVLNQVGCDACSTQILRGAGAYFSCDRTLCTACYNQRLYIFNSMNQHAVGSKTWCGVCKMFTDNSAHKETHALNVKLEEMETKKPEGPQVPTQPEPNPWYQEVLRKHDGEPCTIPADCQCCHKDIQPDSEAWFAGPKITDSIICCECYNKHKPTTAKVPSNIVSQTNGNIGFATSWHHKHEPHQIIQGKDDAWGVWAASRDGLIAHANDFDIVMNMSGRTITERHAIPIPELEKWKHGGDTFKEMLLDWPDNGVCYFPLQFWLDVIEHIQTNKLKLVANCIGGHGRTGTALACLMIAGLGWKGSKSIDWIRKNYCDRAIESKEQEAYIHSISKNMKAWKKEHPEAFSNQ